MKIYLDDERKAPEGWIQCRWPAEVIEYLKTGKVTHLSLDHDLGEGSEYAHPRTGMDVLTWLEHEVYAQRIKFIPRIYVHSQNPSAGGAMKALLMGIHRMLQPDYEAPF